MNIKTGRIAIAVIATEILGILSLGILIDLFGPSDEAAAQVFAVRLGFWVGPISGFILCLLGAFWVTRRLSDSHLANGLMLGGAAAALDVGFLLAMGVSSEPIVAISNIGRIVAGVIGGRLAGHLRGANRNAVPK